jgi:hypothetical protein
MFWAADIYFDRQYVVEVIEPTSLYSLPPTDYPEKNPVLVSLTARNHLRVLRIRYGKDFLTLKVETEDGRVGWIFGDEGVKVISPNG